MGERIATGVVRQLLWSAVALTGVVAVVSLSNHSSTDSALSPAVVARPTVTAAPPPSAPAPSIVTTATPATATPPTTVAPTTTITPPPRAEFDAAIRSLKDHRLASQLQISAAVWVEGHGEVASLNPDLLLFPASNQKLFTAAGAFELLDPQFRFSTQLLTDGSDLYLRAGGDPSLTSAHLAALANRAAAAGQTSVPGDLVIDASRYESATMAPGWQDWQMPTYVGPLSAFTVDDNRWTKSDRFVADPVVVNGLRFSDQLRTRGVAVAGTVREGRVPLGAEVVAEHESVPVVELLGQMMLSSDNQIAEAFIREMAAVSGGDGSTAQGTEAAKTAFDRAGLILGGEDGDGSGLSRANLRSSRQWQQLLVWARDQPWFDQFDAALPIAGRTGTLSGRLTQASTFGNVRAKTGTIIGGRALSGYLTLAGGEEAVFSIVVNGDSSHLALGLIDDFVRRLAAVQLLPAVVAVD